MFVTCLLNQSNVFCLTSLDVSTSLLVGPLGHWFIIPCLLVFWFDCCFFGFFGLIVVFLVGLELLAPIPIIHASIIHYQIRKGGEKSLCCAEQ